MEQFIEVKRMKYDQARSNKWAIPVDSEMTATIRLSNIVSVHDDATGAKNQMPGQRFICIISMTNGKSFLVTHKTGSEVLKAWKEWLKTYGSLA